MALEIQLLLQGDSRAAVQADIVEGEPAYNTDPIKDELIYHVKGSPGTFKYFPSLDKLIQSVKADTAGAQLIGFDDADVGTFAASNVQEAIEALNGLVEVSSAGANNFLDQFEPIANGSSELVGVNGDWADTGGWVSTVDAEFTFTDVGGDGLSINATPDPGFEGFVNNAWYAITYTATNGGTPTSATLQMDASSFTSDPSTFNLPTTDGTYTIFFRSGAGIAGFRIEAINSDLGVGSIVLSNVSIVRADNSTGGSSRANAINGDTTFSGFNINFNNIGSGSLFTITRLESHGMDLQSEHSESAVSENQTTWADNYNSLNTDVDAFITTGRFSIEANENWTASNQGTKMIWSIIRDGSTLAVASMELNGNNNGELRLKSSAQFRYSTDPIAIGAETLTHYITAVDNTGNAIKLAVLT